MNTHNTWTTLRPCLPLTWCGLNWTVVHKDSTTMAPDLQSQRPIFDSIEKLVRYFHIEVLSVVEAMDSVQWGRIWPHPQGQYGWKNDPTPCPGSRTCTGRKRETTQPADHLPQEQIHYLARRKRTKQHWTHHRHSLSKKNNLTHQWDREKAFFNKLIHYFPVTCTSTHSKHQLHVWHLHTIYSTTKTNNLQPHQNFITPQQPLPTHIWWTYTHITRPAPNMPA